MLVKLRSLRHTTDELTGLELPDLHVFVDELELTLVRHAAHQWIALDVGFDDLAVDLEELYLPQLVEDMLREEDDLGAFIVRYKPRLRIRRNTVVTVVAEYLTATVLGLDHGLQDLA